MSDPAKVPEGFQPVSLTRATAEQYCLTAIQKRHNEMWWYFNGLAPFRGYSRPFKDNHGLWWYTPKPCFAWPVDFFTPRDPAVRGLPRRALLGAQWPVDEHADADSRVWMNVIRDLGDYGTGSVASNKRRAIRKGLRNLTVQAVDPGDSKIAREACEVWNSHVQRTGWNSQMSHEQFAESWKELSDWPGTTVIAATHKTDRDAICAWTIVRAVDSVVYIDTLASHSDRLASRPNDAVLFVCLASASQQGIPRAHYSLKSNIKSLEAFKESLGFEAYGFPSRLRLRWPVASLLRLLKPRTYERLLGNLDRTREE